MAPTDAHSKGASRLSPKALTLFAAILIAFCIQSALTEYVQGTLEYRQPFLLFYIAHSSFSIILPLHLAWLSLTSSTPLATHLHLLKLALASKFSRNASSDAFPMTRFLTVVAALTVGATGPGLLWYASVSLTSISDITALWNANALWAYALAVPILRAPWSWRAACAVLLAFLGTLAVVYGAAPPSSKKDDASQPLLGAGLAFAASVAYALYQVLYKRFVALDGGGAAPLAGPGDAAAYSSIYSRDDDFDARDEDDLEDPDFDGATLTDELPFGLYPNALTSSIGLGTFLLLGLVVLYTAPPPPPNLRTTLSIAGIAMNGVVFNSGYLVLLGLWGPVLTSVGSLLTIVLMLAYDLVVGGLGHLTFWSFAGSGAIITGFAVLMLDVVQIPAGGPGAVH